MEKNYLKFKNSVDKQISKLDSAEERFCELEMRAEEVLQNVAQRDRNERYESKAKRLGGYPEKF